MGCCRYALFSTDVKKKVSLTRNCLANVIVENETMFIFLFRAEEKQSHAFSITVNKYFQDIYIIKI